MPGKTDAARSALRSIEHHLLPAQHEPIIQALSDWGLLDKPVPDSGRLDRSDGDQVHAREASRLNRLEAAMADPVLAPAARYAVGSLRRLGISIEAAADINTLNDSMSKQGLSPEQRVGIKTALARAGIID